MRDRQSIIGFTEAELGLVLALVALALWATSVPTTSAENVVTIPQVALDALKDTVKQARAWKKSSDSLFALAGKRSNQTPMCREKGYPDRSIATITILGNDNYQMNGEVTSLNEILTGLAAPQGFAKSHGCRHTVIVRARAGLPAELFTPAFVRLRGYFNTRVQ